MCHNPKKRNQKLQIDQGLSESLNRGSISKAPDKSKKNFYVHELVAKTFVPNPHNLPYIEHIDGNRLNNQASNLRWTAIMPDGYPR